MKQTAVEWLENQIMTSKYFYSLMKELNSRGTIVQPNVFEQAKAMEKEQIVNAYNDCEWTGDHEDGEQYYNETFNKSINKRG
jgi:HEPN domain-containing protein